MFGPRQDPYGAYAAVIPKWIAALIEGRKVQIFGDGETSRDFCYIENAVQANVLAATAPITGAVCKVYNVAVGDRLSLSALFESCRQLLADRYETARDAVPLYGDFRAGDVRHSQADISNARADLGYVPTHRVSEGLRAAMDWYVANHDVSALNEQS